MRIKKFHLSLSIWRRILQGSNFYITWRFHLVRSIEQGREVYMVVGMELIIVWRETEKEPFDRAC